MQLSGQQVVYDAYGQARPNLVRRLGDYCSYCEMRVTSGLAVEHIVSKKDDPTRERDWGNFLLACPSCNSTKARKVKSEADTANYLWPHRDRSFDAFDYRAGAVRVARDLDPATQAKAEATERMVGLSRRPHHGLSRDQIQKGTDNRWRHRIEAHRVAKRALERLAKVASAPQLRADQVDAIRDIARGHGFWSVWMTVFADHPDVQSALIDTFEGSARARIEPPALPPR